MVVAIDVVKDDLDTLFVEVALTGLTPGTKYDVFRLTLRYLGDNDTGAPVYEREIPDRAALWRAVGHRVGWTAPAAAATFRDYEVSLRPTVYYVCASSAEGPHEYEDWGTPYPVARGVLDDEVIHFNRDLDLAVDGPEVSDEGHVIIRSTEELNKYLSLCLVDMDGPKYTARGTEHAVLGSQYPVYVADTREARRGSLTVMVRDLGAYNDLRSIVFPPTGRIRPVIFNSGGDNTLLLDDMVVIPLDVAVEQVTAQSLASRYVHVDYVEIDARAALTQRSGDNDTMVNAPVANFTISDTTPAVHQWVTLTDTSTGLYDEWDWTIERGYETDNRVGKFYGPGPHVIRWGNRGKKTIKLRVGGSGAGHHTRYKTATVH